MKKKDFLLLEKLTSIHATSGNEELLRNFLVVYFKNNFSDKVEIKKINGGLVVVRGNPKYVLFSHMDSTGYMVGYNNEILGIGSPVFDQNMTLVDKKGKLFDVEKNNDLTFLKSKKTIKRGKRLVFKNNIRTEKGKIYSAYLDNRLGVFVALKSIENKKNFALCFSCYEETGGGNAAVLAKYVYKKHKIKKAIICDITWHTEGIKFNKGIVISLKDVAIPRQKFVDKIIKRCVGNNIKFQLEVEKSGGSDGTEIQKSILPMDWVFIGIPQKNPHSNKEEVYIKDVYDLIKFYKTI